MLDRGDDRYRTAILRYLLQHPEARDTVKGIFEWWLGEDASRPEEQQDVIDCLCREGWLVASEATGKTVYGLAEGATARLSAYLRNSMLGEDHRP